MFKKQGDRLKYIRKIKKLTQQEMANCLGIPLRTYQTYESNKNLVSSKVCIELFVHFEISIDWILTGKTTIQQADILIGHNITLNETRKINKIDIFKRIIDTWYYKNNKVINNDLFKDDTKIMTEIENILKVDIITYSELHKLLNIPWLAIFSYAHKNDLYLEWILFGTIDNEKVDINIAINKSFFNDKLSSSKEFITYKSNTINYNKYSEIIELLSYAPDNFLETLKKKLQKDKEEQEIFLDSIS